MLIQLPERTQIKKTDERTGAEYSGTAQREDKEPGRPIPPSSELFPDGATSGTALQPGDTGRPGREDTASAGGRYDVPNGKNPIHDGEPGTRLSLPNKG